MARTNSTGLPFLIRRPDTGKFAYSRELPASLVAHVRGEVDLPWSTKGTRLLDGTAKVIKISLKTGDDATARVRWSRINDQVEALVQFAAVLSRQGAEKVEPEPARPVPAEAVETIAAQARHDLLAEHDQSWVDPSFTSPLTGVVLRLMRQAGARSGSKTLQAAQSFAQDLLIDQARRDLMARHPGMLDAEIIETEYPVHPDLDLAAARRGEVRLSADEIAGLGKPTVVGRLPGEVEARLAENGFGQVSDADRRAVSLALLRTRIQGLQDLKARDAGAPIFTPSRPAALAPSPVASKPVLSAMQKHWIKDRRPGPKEIDDKTTYLRYFIDLHGDLPVDQITPPMVAEFLGKLEECLRNYPHALRRATLQDRVAFAKKPDNAAKPRLKRTTINSKGLGSVAALLEQARKLGYVATNACDRMALTIRPEDVVARVPYGLTDLRRIFCSGVFAVPGELFWLRGADHWLPLLGLYTGARLEELGQLLVDDIRTVAGIPCLSITDLPDPDVDTGQTADKSVKTVAARRLVPIHAELIRCGFIEFVEAQRRRRSGRLFPELASYRGRVTKEWSKAWGRFTDKHVTTSPAKSYHSFRHLLIAKLRGVDLNVVKALVGHQIEDVTLNYGAEDGAPFPIATLNTAIQTFAVAGLDLSHLYRPGF